MTRKKSLKIAVDLDGCVVDMISILKLILKQKDDPCFFEIGRCWGYSEPEVQDIFRREVRKNQLFLRSSVYRGAKAALTKLKEDGHTLHVVTARGQEPESIAQTAWWLGDRRRDLFNLFDSFSFSSDKTIINADMIIEDRPDTCEKVYKAGIRPILLTRPWNDPTYQCSKHTPADNKDKPCSDYRVDSWEEVVEYVRNYGTTKR